MGNSKGTLVYFVTHGPRSEFLLDGTEVWQCMAQVSPDGGKTVGPMVFTFETEEDAIAFKYDVNSEMEPMKIGKDDEDEQSFNR